MLLMISSGSGEFASWLIAFPPLHGYGSAETLYGSCFFLMKDTARFQSFLSKVQSGRNMLR